MYSIATAAVTIALSAATNQGVLTVASTALLFPGANAWVYLADDSQHARCKILAVIDATHVQVRRYKNDNEWLATPQYGHSDMSAFNAAGFVSCEAQVVPVDPAYSKRVIP